MPIIGTTRTSDIIAPILIDVAWSAYILDPATNPPRNEANQTVKKWTKGTIIRAKVIKAPIKLDLSKLLIVIPLDW